MSIYKTGDIVRLKENNESSIPFIYNNQEAIVTYSNITEKEMISFYNQEDEFESKYYFNDSDVELIGWTYIPDYELIKGKTFILTDTDILNSRLSPEINKNTIKICPDIEGYYFRFNDNMSLSLQNKNVNNTSEYDDLLFKIEIRIDGTIKIFTIPIDIIDPSIIEEYKNIFNNYFDDCEIREINKSEYEFVIHFPEITIKNELNKTHLIRDLYVLFNLVQEDNRLIFKRDEDPNYYLAGCRGTMTEKEYVVSYQHSHLNVNYNISKFCLGTGPILTNIAAFNMENNNLLFEKIMLDIIDYVSVESIEGTPYIPFSSIYKKRQNSNSHISTTHLHREYLKFLSTYSNIPISINDNFKIEVSADNPKFIEQVSAITNYINESESNIRIDPNIKGRLMLIFKNEEVKLKIIKEEDEQNKERQPTRTADERVCKYISTKLSEDLTSKIISGITRKSGAGYFTGIVVEDTPITPECGKDRVVRSIVYKGGRRLAKL